MENSRRFQAGPDPFGRTWEVEFQWLQTAISIRHADAVDVKYIVWTDDEPKQERVIAMSHPELLAVCHAVDHPLSDPFCMKLSAMHITRMIETFEDMSKTLVTMRYDELLEYARKLTEKPQFVTR